MRRFVLRRDVDVTGVSGTGVVAEGVEFGDRAVAIRWLGEHPSLVAWANIVDAMTIHGHGGNTTLVWLDYKD
jgi:hypothetical protein